MLFQKYDFSPQYKSVIFIEANIKIFFYFYFFIWYLPPPLPKKKGGRERLLLAVSELF